MHQDVWVALRPSELVWRDWDDFGVVYDGASGDTHLLGVLGIEILALLAAAPRREHEVISELSSAMPDDLDPDQASLLIVNQLKQLRSLGMVDLDSRPG